MQQYEAMVIEAFRIQSSVTLGLNSLVVYSEYFGGFYHSEHMMQDGVGCGQPVKEVVAYSPTHDYILLMSVPMAFIWILTLPPTC